MLITIANVLAGLIGAGIILIGVRAFWAPQAAAGFGIPDTPTEDPSFRAWLSWLDTALLGWRRFDLGTDIAGCVEFRPDGPDTPWLPARIDLDKLPRNYDAFGLLFGVCNYAGFEPVAAARGIPEDASEAVRAVPRLDARHDHTWVTWAELARIDWERPASATDDRLHEYRITSQGLIKLGKANVGSGLAWRAVAGEHADPRGSSYPEGTEWRSGDHLWRVERLVQGDVLRTDPELRAVLDAMHELGERHGEDNVRLVVWFDR